MSVVTNAILHMSNMEREEDRLNDVNKFFPPETGFVDVDDPKLPTGWYGGTKMLEAPLALGAFNHLDLEGLITHLKSIPWEEPQEVQLIVQEQEDEKFRIIEL